MDGTGRQTDGRTLDRFIDSRGWRRGTVVSGVRLMNEVYPHRARLVPGWVTVFRWVYTGQPGQLSLASLRGR